MNKVVLGLLLGGVLGLIDGATAWFTPAVRHLMLGIIIGSTLKGMIAGIAAGWFARKVNNVGAGIVFGFAVGLLLAFIVAAMPSETGEHYWWQIMLPGSVLGAVVGWATQRYGRPARTSSATAGVLAGALLLVIAGGARAAEVTPADALARLKSLEGRWEGNIIKPDGPATTFDYRITAGGSVVIETLFAGTPHEMVTVYSVDKDDLVATHYCSAGNQPTMKLDRAGSTPEKLVFRFVSVRGEHAHDREHIHSGVIRFVDANRIEGVWAGGKETTETDQKRFYLRRAK